MKNNFATNICIKLVLMLNGFFIFEADLSSMKLFYTKSRMISHNS